MQDGYLLVDKPAGISSFGVVARVRGILSRRADKKVKVGHTGTLDPFATGLMIIVVGKECKKAGEYSKLDKVYEASFLLGQTSTTGDPEGEIINVSDKKPEIAEIKNVLERFVGDITQKPPIFSAIKINGQRAYKLARQGGPIDMPSRQVKVYELELMNYDYPHLSVRAHVGSGTYIRSLAQDIGEELGTGAYCEALRRTKISKWSVDSAQTIEEL